ncbi:MAG: hypothetical protein AB1758_37155 [Candidatus Eremiobacterota bacterium]
MGLRARSVVWLGGGLVCAGLLWLALERRPHPPVAEPTPDAARVTVRGRLTRVSSNGASAVLEFREIPLTLETDVAPGVQGDFEIRLQVRGPTRPSRVHATVTTADGRQFEGDARIDAAGLAWLELAPRPAPGSTRVPVATPGPVSPQTLARGQAREAELRQQQERQARRR